MFISKVLIRTSLGRNLYLKVNYVNIIIFTSRMEFFIHILTDTFFNDFVKVSKSLENMLVVVSNSQDKH